MIPLILVQPECLANPYWPFSKQKSPVLVTKLTGHTLKQRIQLLTMKFFRESPLCPYSECRLIQLLIKRPLEVGQKFKKKKKRQNPRVRSVLKS